MAHICTGHLAERRERTVGATLDLVIALLAGNLYEVMAARRILIELRKEIGDES